MDNDEMDVVNNTTPTCIYPESKTCKTMKKNAKEYVKIIQEEYKKKGYKIIEPPLNVDKKFFEYKIQNELNKDVCTIEILLIIKKYKRHHTRSNTNSNAIQPSNGIYISSLYTEEKYRGQGHATKLLLYAICNTFLNYLNLNLVFVKLEDATVGNQRRMKGHIYHNIGFTPTGIIELNMNRNDYMKGINSGRDVTMEYLLMAIVPMKSVKQGGSSKRKTSKRKTKKNKRAL